MILNSSCLATPLRVLNTSNKFSYVPGYKYPDAALLMCKVHLASNMFL